MSLLNDRVEQYRKQKTLREEGKLNLIPFYYHFPKLSKVLPGLFRQGIYKILSNTGIGKSKFSRMLSIIIPFELSKTKDLKFHTIYFSLEESREEFIDAMVVMMLKIHYGIDIDVLTLNSYFEKPLSEDILEKIEKVKVYIDDLMSHVTIVDDIKNPTGIYKYCRDFSESVGHHFTEEVKLNGKIFTENKFKQHDPDLFVLVVVDHISLLNEEYSKIKQKTLDKKETMSLWNDDYCSIISNKWNWVTLNVQQVTMNSDDVTHGKANRLEPELSDAGDNKTILRTDKVILALFDPQRYGLKTYNGHNMNDYKDSFRALKILKNRYGLANRILSLKFEGASGRFTEL